MAYRNEFEDISLLYPAGVPRPPRRLINQTDNTYNLKDLNIKNLVRALSIAPQYEGRIEEILLSPVTSPEILAYRHEIIDDLLRSASLTEQLKSILQVIVNLEAYLVQPDWEDSALRQVAWRLGELENYVDGVVKLNAILSDVGDKLQSTGLIALRDRVMKVAREETFQRLQRELPGLIEQFRGIGSITIGINLNDQLQPTEAMLVSVNTERFYGKSVMGWFFGLGKHQDDDEGDTIGPVHKARRNRNENFGMRFGHESPELATLFDDVEQVMEKTAVPIGKALESYTSVNSRMLINLKMEIAFYLGAVQLIKHMETSGMPTCRPEVVPMEERFFEAHDLYNIGLVLQQSPPHRPTDVGAVIIPNDVTFDDGGRVFILTGPNRGGKTTYTVAVGLAQVMFQAGLFVPASQARISPVDGIYTHFATAENPRLEAGRLGEESIRLNKVFTFATRHSLILLNETFSSTSAVESLHLCNDIVRVMCLMGTRAVFATHLHELAANVETINTQSNGDSRVVSMVSQVDLDQDDEGEIARRTYKIVRGAPVGTSYAREIAARYGISYKKLTKLLHERDIITPDDTPADSAMVE